VFLANGNDIALEAQSRLLRNPWYASTRRVSCEFDNGVLTLQGTAPTYYLKQVAQALLVGIQGVERIDNQIEVTAGTPVWDRRLSASP
jgi:osmotically-inducible protein OsmY